MTSGCLELWMTCCAWLSDIFCTWLPDDLQYLTSGCLDVRITCSTYSGWSVVPLLQMTCSTWLQNDVLYLTSGCLDIRITFSTWLLDEHCSLFPDDLPYLITGWHAVLDFLKTGCTWLQDTLTSGWHAVLYFCKTCCTWLLDDLPYWSSRWLAVIDSRMP